MKRITALFTLSLLFLFWSKAQAQEAKANWAFNAYLGANYDFYRFNITQSNGGRLSTDGLQFGVSRQKKKFYQEFLLVSMNKSSRFLLQPSYDSLGNQINNWKNFTETRSFDYVLAYQAGWQLIGSESSKLKVIGGLSLKYNYQKLKVNEVYDNAYYMFNRWSHHSMYLGVFGKGSYALSKAWSVNMTFLYEPVIGGVSKSVRFPADSRDRTKSYSWYSGISGQYFVDGRLGVSYQF